MELESCMENALLFWFNTYGKSIDLPIVESIEELWKVHLPSLLNCLRTDRNTRIESLNASSTFLDLYTHLMNVTVNETVVETLRVEAAAGGDHLEIAKFLAMLLNEFRISKPDVIKESVAVMEREGQDQPLKDVLNAFDEEHANWWSVMVCPHGCVESSEEHDVDFATPQRTRMNAEEFCGMSVNRSAFITPRLTCRSLIRKQPNNGANTVARCDASPLLDTLNSPKVRELRREREIRSLQKQLHDTEDQLMCTQTEATESKRKVEALIGENTRKKERIIELEANEKWLTGLLNELESALKQSTGKAESLKHSCDSLKEMVKKYKAETERLETEKVSFSEALKDRDHAVLAKDREVRDAKDEVEVAKQNLIRSEMECNNLKKLVEELKKRAESDREDYLASILDWRQRYDKDTSEGMSLYNSEMAKNAGLQRQLRDIEEAYEKLKKQHDETKRSTERCLQELNDDHQQKQETLRQKLAEVESLLARQEERYTDLSNQHRKAMKQAEGVHLAETKQLEEIVRIAKTKNEELESRVSEHELVIWEQREELAVLLADKTILEKELIQLKNSLQSKTAELSSARASVERLEDDIHKVAKQCGDFFSDMEILREEAARLQVLVEEKETELAELRLNNGSLSSEREHLEQELVKTRQDLVQESDNKEILKNQLSDMESKNVEQANKIIQLENALEEQKTAMRENEVRWAFECSFLRKRDSLRTEEISRLYKKFDLLEVKLNECKENNAALKLQIAGLEEENEQFSKCLEVTHANNAHSGSATVSLPMRTAGPLASEIEEEPVSVEITTLDNRNVIEIEGKVSPSEIQRPSQPSSLDVVKSASALSTDKSASVVGQSVSSKSVAYQENNEEALNWDTDRSRLTELQKRNAMVQPALRCAYATEVTTYSSPFANENIMKQGSLSERRKSGAKFFKRASSYVKKRLPLSEASSSHLN